MSEQQHDYDYDDHPDEVVHEITDADVNAFIRGYCDVQSLATFAGDHAGDFDLDAVRDDLWDALDGIRDQIAELLPTDKESFDAVAEICQPHLIAALEAHDLTAADAR